MYIIRNVAASREEGCWHHNPNGFSPDSHTLGFEPWIAGMQLKLYEERIITDKEYEICKDHLAELVTHRVVKIEKLSDDTPVEEIRIIEKAPDKIFDLSDIPEIPKSREIEEVKEEVKEEPKSEVKTIQLPKKKGSR